MAKKKRKYTKRIATEVVKQKRKYTKRKKRKYTKRKDKNLSSAVDHPVHYGGENNPYEAIKIVEASGLDFHVGNAVKYALRAGKKEGNSETQDLKKAVWYLNRKIENLSK